MTTMSHDFTNLPNCVVCDLVVTGQQHALECDNCCRWQHRLCNTGISFNDYKRLVQGEWDLQDWRCAQCSPCPDMSSFMDKRIVESTHLSDDMLNSVTNIVADMANETEDFSAYMESINEDDEAFKDKENLNCSGFFRTPTRLGLNTSSCSSDNESFYGFNKNNMPGANNTFSPPTTPQRVERVGIRDLKFNGTNVKKKVSKFKTPKFKTPKVHHEGTSVFHQTCGNKTKSLNSKKDSPSAQTIYNRNIQNLLENLRKQCSLSGTPPIDGQSTNVEAVIQMAITEIKEWEENMKMINEHKKHHQKIQTALLKRVISLLKESAHQNGDLQAQKKSSQQRKTRKSLPDQVDKRKKFTFPGFRSSSPKYGDQHGPYTAESLFSSNPSGSPLKFLPAELRPCSIFPRFPLSSLVLEEMSEMDFVFKPRFGNSFFSSQAFSSHIEDDEDSSEFMFSPSSFVTKKKMKKKEVAPSSKRKGFNKVNTLPVAKKRGPKKKIQPNPTITLSINSNLNKTSSSVNETLPREKKIQPKPTTTLSTISTGNLNETSSSVNETLPAESEEAERGSAHIDCISEQEPYPRVDSPSGMDSNILYNKSYIRRLTSVTKGLRENEIQLLHQNLRLRSPSSKNTRSKIAMAFKSPSNAAILVRKKKNAAVTGSLTENKKFNPVLRKKLKIVTPQKFKTVVTSNFKIVTPKHSQPVASNKFKRLVGTPKSYLRKVSDSSAIALLRKGKKVARKTATTNKLASHSEGNAVPQDECQMVNTEREATPESQNNGAFQRAATKTMQMEVDNVSFTNNIQTKESLSEPSRSTNNLYSPIARTIVHVPLNNIVGDSDHMYSQNKVSKSQSSLIVTRSTDDLSDDEDSPQLPVTEFRRSFPHHHLSDSINKRASPFNNNMSETPHQTSRNFKDPPKFYYPVHPFISDDFPVHFIPVDANNIPDFLPLYAPIAGAKANAKMYPSFVQVRDLDDDTPGAQYTFSNGIYSKNVPRQTLHESEVLPNLLPGISAATKNPLVPEMNHLRVIKGISKHPADCNRAVSPVLGSRRKAISPIKSNWTPSPSTSKVIVKNTISQLPMVIKLSPPSSMDQVISIPLKFHKCNKCNFKSTKLSAFRRHQVSHNKPDSPPDSNEDILILDSKVRSQVPHTPPLNSMISSSVKITQAPGPAPAPLVAHSESIRFGPHGSPRIISPTHDSESGIKIVSTESLRDALECHRKNNSLAFLDSAEIPLQKRFPSVTITPLLPPYD